MINSIRFGLILYPRLITVSVEQDPFGPTINSLYSKNQAPLYAEFCQACGDQFARVVKSDGQSYAVTAQHAEELAGLIADSDRPEQDVIEDYLRNNRDSTYEIIPYHNMPGSTIRPLSS